jgi:hypothetical protein
MVGMESILCFGQVSYIARHVFHLDWKVNERSGKLDMYFFVLESYSFLLTSTWFV